MGQTANPREAARALAAGDLVGLPTETVYGLGAWADDPAAVAALYWAKGRPADHPVIVHVAGPGALAAWADSAPDYAAVLTAHFWPGPLTLVLPRSPRARDDLTGGQPTVALRVPDHPDFARVIEELGTVTGDPFVGIAAPSANRFGRVSPTTAEHVWAEFDIRVVDGGPCEVGVESTIVDCTSANPTLLRAGAISAADIESATGLDVTHDSDVRAPGTLASHYAPRAKVHTVEFGQPITLHQPTTGFIALAEIPTPESMTRLAAPASVAAYARELYAALRASDDQGCTDVVAVLPEASGIGIAVRDRLLRAAATTSEPSATPHRFGSSPR